MRCSNCGKKVPDTAKVCGYCGQRVATAEVPKKEKAAPVVAKKTKPAPDVKEEVPKSARKIKKLWLWLVGAVLLIALVTVLVVLLARGSSPVTTTVIPILQGGSSAAGATMVPASNAILDDPGYFPTYLQNKLANPKVLFYENFDVWQNHEWYTSANVSSVSDSNAILRLPGTEDLGTYLCSQEYYQNRGILTKVMMTNPPFQMEFFVAQNQWATSDYMRFGGAIYDTDQLQTTIWAGTNNDMSNIDMDGPLALKENTWYGLFIGQDNDGDFIIFMWDLNDPAYQYTGYTIKRSDSWTSGEWHSCFQIGRGTLYVDDFSIISHEGIH